MKKNSSDNLPAFQFYPNDWLGDMNLRMCSVGTRGVWIDLLCLMHKSKKYGFLVHKVDGKWANMSPKTIQKLTGMTTKRIIIGIQELSKNDVIKHDAHGLIYSKRMVKDHALRVIRKEVGKLGGNPALVNQSPNQTGNQKTPPSSSSSSSLSSSTSKEPKPPIVPQGGNGMVRERFDKFINLYPNAVAKDKAWVAWQQLFVKGFAGRRCTTKFLSTLTDKLFNEIIEGVEAQTKERKWKKEAKVWMAPWTHPATWLRAKRWEDRVEEKPEETVRKFEFLEGGNENKQDRY